MVITDDLLIDGDIPEFVVDFVENGVVVFEDVDSVVVVVVVVDGLPGTALG